LQTWSVKVCDLVTDL